MERKINAELDRSGERINVNVKFFESGKVVHEINQAFPKYSDKEYIVKEIDKAEKLFLREKEDAEQQKKVDAEREKVNKTVDSLNKMNK